MRQCCGIRGELGRQGAACTELLDGMLREVGWAHRMKPTLQERGLSLAKRCPPAPRHPVGLCGTPPCCCWVNAASPPWETEAPVSPNRQACDGIPDARETKDTSTQGPLRKPEAYSSSGMGLGREANRLLGLPGLCLQAVVSSVCQVP